MGQVLSNGFFAALSVTLLAALCPRIARAADQYDGRGQLWRASEAHCINYYDAQTFWSTLEVHTDLQNGRYLAIGLDNENEMYDFTIKRTPADYTPDSLRRDGVR